MKKLVKFLSVGIACLLLITSFFFIPKNKLEITSAINTMSITSDYDGELSTDYYGFGDFAISELEQVQIEGEYYLTFESNYPVAYSYVFGFLTDEYFSSAQYFDYLILNDTDFNMCVMVESGSIALESKTAVSYNGSSYYALNAFNMSANTTLRFYFSTCNFSVDSNKNVSLVRQTISTQFYSGQDYSSIFDMNSDTQYQVPYFVQWSDNPLAETVLEFINSSNSSTLDTSFNSLFSDSSITCYSSRNNTVRNYNVFGLRHLTFRINRENITQSLLVYSLEFLIYQPSYRVNNSLIIYNYDYLSVLSDVSSLFYLLTLNDDLYYVNYDDSLPNSKYIQIFNNDLNNIIFDSYISFELSFDNFSTSIDSSSFTSNDLAFGFVSSFSLGFDFNFSYYVQPLVSNNSSYNYEFEKPSYKDGSIKLSITPPRLDIPVLAWAENILIFFLFYCPVISDLIELINFDKFFAVLLQIFDIYTSSALGDFVLGCFAFILFWNMLVLIMPRFVASSKGWENAPIKDTVTAINSNIKSNKKKKETALRLRTSRNNRVRLYKHNKHDKSYMRSSSFTSFKSKNNINRYERAKHRYLRKK